MLLHVTERHGMSRVSQKVTVDNCVIYSYIKKDQKKKKKKKRLSEDKRFWVLPLIYVSRSVPGDRLAGLVVKASALREGLTCVKV